MCPAKVIYVDADATGANDGTSWENACYYLQDGLMLAVGGNEIRVAQGVYRPDDFVLSERPNLGRAETFALKTGLILKGGYAGFGQADPNARDIELYETILSGDRDANDVEPSDVRDIIYDPSRAENCYHVVSAIEIDNTAVLDGFIITGGNANDGWEHESGGGMIIDSAHPIVKNCTFRRNSACTWERGHGGGLALEGGSLTLLSCTFIENVADTEVRDHGGGNGGGMYSYSGGNTTVIDCRFIRNYAPGNDGGAIYLGGGENTLTNCLFVENSARWSGGAVRSYGEVTVTGCTFIGNEVVIGNAGAMYTSFSSARLSDCTFIGNRAGRAGGALELGGFSKLLNCLFAGNVAKEFGGGIYISPVSKMILINSTFAGNRASAGRTLATRSYYYDYYSNIALTNCILWNGGDEIANYDGSVINVAYSNVEGGEASIYDPHNMAFWGEGNIDTDPCFVDAGYWDPNGTLEDANDDFWVNGDYHLKSQAGSWPPAGVWVRDDVTSPCIDAGDSYTPIGPEPFPNGGILNMGAYGGTTEASKSYFGKPPWEIIIAGDINGDCEVNFLDFRLMALHWCEDYNL
jgi:predicted outer membrane repeat protein